MPCHNPGQARRDRLVRDRLVTHLEGLIGGSDAWTQRKRDELAGSLKDKPGLRLYLRRTPPESRVCRSRRDAGEDPLLDVSRITARAVYPALGAAGAIRQSATDVASAIGERPIAGVAKAASRAQ